MEEIYTKPYFTAGFNSSFIILIPKVDNPLFIKDYHSISIVGLKFKIIANVTFEISGMIVCVSNFEDLGGT